MRYFENKIHNAVLYVLVIAAGLSILCYGVIKTGAKLEITSLFDSGANKYIISHHADEIYGMAAGYGLMDAGIITFFDRIQNGIGFFLQMVVPASFFPTNMRFPQILTANATVGGGGMVMFGAYFFWGYAGVSLFSFVFSMVVLRAYRSDSRLFMIWVFITLVFVFNWTSYDFHTILRWPFYACILAVFYKGVKLRYIKNG